MVLGTAAEPWESLPERRRLLACLDGFLGLRLRLTCRTDKVVEDVEVLHWLDRDHAVRVEFRLDAARLRRLGFDSPYVQRLCKAVRILAAYGLETRLVVESNSEMPDGALRRDLRRLAEDLASSGATDLLLTDDASVGWKQAVGPLRLAYGFAAAGPVGD